MTTSGTYAGTYTVLDVGRVVDCFAADYDMIAQATDLASQGLVTDTVHDVKLLAEMKYLAGVDIVLQDQYGRVVRAAKYTVSTDASLWSTERPGNNLWPRIASGSLVVVVSYTHKWWNLGEERRRRFQREYLRISWVPSGINLSYPGLFGQVDRRYASNAYGMERTSYS